MNDITELTLDELIALDVLPLEEAEGEGWDVVMDGAVKLVKAGRSENALPYLESAAASLDKLTQRYLTAYDLLESFNFEVTTTQEYVTAKIDVALLQAIREWCHGEGGQE